MGDRSRIEWTDATWNPTTGCTKVSAGCDNCYAESMANGRLKRAYLNQLPVVDTPENRENPFAVRVWPERLDQPIRWTRPRRIFVNSMSDLFHKDIPEHFLFRIFSTMMKATHHQFQVLTKRPSRVRRFWENWGTSVLIPDHIWIGTSIEDDRAAYRLDHLKIVPAKVLFLSCEPIIGPIGKLNLRGPLHNISWVIAGGESGRNARPMNPDWVRDLRDQCLTDRVPFFFKQWGGRTPKAGGRVLDGRTWSLMPGDDMHEYNFEREDVGGVDDTTQNHEDARRESSRMARRKP